MVSIHTYINTYMDIHLQSRLGHWIFWLRFIVVFLIPSRHIPREYLDWATTAFFQILSSSCHPTIRRYVVRILTGPSNKPQRKLHIHKSYTKRPNFCDNRSRIPESVTFQVTFLPFTSLFAYSHSEMQQLEF
jgi:hypothetical protein